MISYCWAEKTICKKIFERLNSHGYRIWFDEQNMCGNSLSAMANAIESSQCIIVCMSENYENSNACHHEAEYAYVLQRRIVPLVVQSKYKARRWLGFVTGALVYVDFTKHEFDKAFGELQKQVKYDDKSVEQTTKKSDKKTVESEKQDDMATHAVIDPIEKKVESKRVISTAHENKRINEWTPDDVISWCHTHHLSTFLHLLEHYDGISLLRLYSISKTNGDNDVFRLLQDDCQRIAANGQIKLTFTEFVRFQSELDKRMGKETTRIEPMPTQTPKSAKFCSLF